MKFSNPFGGWYCSLLDCLELGRKRRLRRVQFSAPPAEIEHLEPRQLLSSTVQFDVRSVLNADVVINKPGNGNGQNGIDKTQSPVDRNISGADWSLMTQSAANALMPASDSNAAALPDNGFIAANAFHPDVQLAVNNGDNGNNARRADVDGLVLPISQFAFTLNVPQGNYSDVHLFLTAGNGAATFTAKLNYSDGTSTTSGSTVVPDWFTNSLTDTAAVYKLITNMDREKADLSGWQDANAATIFGFHFTADSTKQLQSITLTPVNVPGSIVFFGGTGVLANGKPVLNTIADQNINEQNTLTVKTQAVDPDGEPVTYSLDAAPPGATINATTGVFTWTPTEAQGPGFYTITVRATDNGSPPLSDVKSFNVTVNEVNIAPTLANPGNQSVNELTPLSFALAATDPDLPPNTLTYSILDGALPGMSLDPNTGAFSWTPTDQQVGVAKVTFGVSDGEGGTDSKTVKITVNDVEIAPVLTIVNPPPVVKSTNLTALVATATDSDSDNDNTDLTFSLVQTGGPGDASGARIDSHTGVFTWTPSASQATGDYTFNVAVDDNTDSADSAAVEPLTVMVTSAGIVNGNLLVLGTRGNDNIAVDPGSAAGTVAVTVNAEHYVFDSSQITGEIQVLSLQGNDIVEVNGDLNHPFDVKGGGGGDSLIVTASDANDTIAITHNAVTVDGNFISFNGEAALAIDALGGNDAVTMTGTEPVTQTTIEGGSGYNSFVLNFTGAFKEGLVLIDMESANLSIGGDFSGNLTSQEDPAAPGSGVINSFYIGGSVTGSGTIDAGAILKTTIVGDMHGSMVAEGAGTISDLTIEGTLDGSVNAPEDSNADSGTITNTTIGSVGSTGSVSTGTVNGMTVTGTMAGTVTAQGAGSISDLNIGTLSGKVAAVLDSHAGSGTIGAFKAGSVSKTGSVTGKNFGSLQVTGDDAGNIVASGTVGNANIGTISGTLSAGTLNALTVSGGISGNVDATNVGVVTATSAWGNGGTVFKIGQDVAGGTEIVRQVVAFPVNAATLSGVSFTTVYDGTCSGNPQAAVRITNNSPSSNTFDLELITNTANEFDLSRLDAGGGSSGIRNVVVQGNILSTMTAAVAGDLGLVPNAGGVQLPNDKLNGVFAADNIAGGSIAAKSVQAVSFGSVTAGGVTTPASSATNTTALATLKAGTGLAQAAGTYVIPFSEHQPVAMFLATASAPTTFDAAPVLFTDQSIDNQSITAVVTSTAAAGGKATIQSIALSGSGGAIQTAQWIQTAITGTGPIGDLILSASQGITAAVTAPAFTGNIDAVNGPISGTITATGSMTPGGILAGNLGSAFSVGGTITGLTYIHAAGGGITGKIIVSHGNLISSVRSDGGLSGLIAAQGDIGAIQWSNGHVFVGGDIAKSLTRFGGILVNGNMSGQIVALGNVYGDITLNGGISGQMAVHGQQLSDLAVGRYGILGRLTINGTIAAGAVIVSDGVIGDDGIYVGTTDSDAYGTQITFASDKGILGAEGDINYGKTGKLPGTGVYENAAGTSDGNVINSIFTTGNGPPTFDNGGLDAILKKLAALRVDATGHLTDAT